ncbi:hypothetical protein [Winogradskyella wichelsiae]|uniref:hypothetical protein n=1 Tax=Winogradskyella wichelsiae TaxID=2697007 RepID=UPI0015CE7E8E|nr:hypothetical protein [Winogradskyella wichelsiae]
MKKHKKILLIIPDGVGIKNYLYSKLLTELKSDDIQIVIWSPLPKEVFNEVERLHGITIEYKAIILLAEPPLTRLYREATTYARLKHNVILKNNTSLLTNWPKPKGYSKRAFMQRIAQVLGNYLTKDYKRILSYEAKSKQHWGMAVIAKYKAYLEALQPQSVFITHQRVGSLMPICLAAKQLNIKVTTAIFSWDNLPKARLCVTADQYLVWGDWMQREMADYYPEIPSEQIKLVGTPQFEFYLEDKQVIPRKAFAKQHNLDENKAWICFSGDDEKTSPYDPQYLYDLAASLKGRTDIQIIFRRCPVDFSERYNQVLEQFQSHIVAIDPIWNKISGNWGGYYPDYKDVNLQLNLAMHCELVYNLGSTMAFDFSIFNKPCIYINYDVAHNRDWSVTTIYQYQHFRSMKNLEGVVWLNSKQEIIKTIDQVLTKPTDMAKDKEQWRKRVVLHPLNESSRYIAQNLVENVSN